MESSNNTNSNNNNQWKAEEAIGGNTEALEALRELIIFPLHYSPQAQKLGLKWPRGLLLYGPPGTGKGILVLAATNRPYAIDAALIRPGRFDLIMASLSSKDLICGRETRELHGRINRLWKVMQRENTVRYMHIVLLDIKVLYVPPPDLETRYEILCVHTRKMKTASDVVLRRLAEDTELFTGAELEGFCREAGIVALREDIFATIVCDRHFQTVKNSLKPALTEAEINSYSSFMKTSSQALPRHFESGLKLDRNKNNSNPKSLTQWWSVPHPSSSLSILYLPSHPFTRLRSHSHLRFTANLPPPNPHLFELGVALPCRVFVAASPLRLNELHHHEPCSLVPPTRVAQGSEWKEKAENLQVELRQCYKAQSWLPDQLIDELASRMPKIKEGFGVLAFLNKRVKFIFGVYLKLYGLAGMARTGFSQLLRNRWITTIRKDVYIDGKGLFLPSQIVGSEVCSCPSSTQAGEEKRKAQTSISTT
ncbi:hypothetical protein RIF29_16071 [Crotalaria pallida]|uniref:AAA ATPase AAA+ lid domain-containing protein n=1 Tax=Crotalaria pallida TaxID=3830 RepID=A0AAN9FN13_CROPI